MATVTALANKLHKLALVRSYLSSLSQVTNFSEGCRRSLEGGDVPAAFSSFVQLCELRDSDIIKRGTALHVRVVITVTFRNVFTSFRLVQLQGVAERRAASLARQLRKRLSESLQQSLTTMHWPVLRQQTSPDVNLSPVRGVVASATVSSCMMFADAGSVQPFRAKF